MSSELKRAALLLFGAVILAYGGSLQGSFHFDDSHSVENNFAVRSLANIPSFWTDPTTSSMIPENRVYRPLVYTFYAVCWAIGKGSTVPFHVMKMLMHSLVCLGVFLIWRRLWSLPGWWPDAQGEPLRLRLVGVRKPVELTPQTGALLLALLFAVHPAGSECVNYISSTTSLQCALFYVFAFVSYLEGRFSKSPRKYLGASLLFYFLSVASKEEGITLPAVILGTEWLLRPERDLVVRFKKAFGVFAPYLVLGLALAAWLFLFHSTEGDESRGSISSWSYFMTQWRAYLHYMRLWFWPWGLNADSASWVFSKSLGEPEVLQALVGNGVVLATAWVQRKRFPALFFGVAWFYVTISPASSVVVLAEAVNERRMYLAYVGFIGGTAVLLIAAARHWVREVHREWKLGVGLTAVFLSLWLGTQERNRVWANDENLWKDTVEKNPYSGRAHNNLALVYMGRGDFTRAIEHFDLCERYWTGYAYCSLNRGIALTALGKLEEAEVYLRKAHGMAPRNIHMNFHLGQFLEEKRNDCEKALPFFQRSAEGANGRYPAADYRAASCLGQLKRWTEARAALQRALGQEPQSVFGWMALGRLELDAGDAAAANSAFRAALRYEPGNVQAWYNLGVAQIRESRWQEARASLAEVVRLDPKSEQGWYNSAFVHEQLGEWDLAVGAAQRLTELYPEKAEYSDRKLRLERRRAEAGK
jgi:tetratricopeptide (TPR) repeat protein